MRRLIFALSLSLIASSTDAQFNPGGVGGAGGFNGPGAFGADGFDGGGASGGPAPGAALRAANGTNYVFAANGTSHICLAGVSSC